MYTSKEEEVWRIELFNSKLRPMFGICIYNLVAIRAEASDRSEMVTQLLFGDTFEVIGTSENGKWQEIKILEDGYTGWMDKKLFFPISVEEIQAQEKASHFVSTDTVAFVKDNASIFPIFFGSYLPLFDGDYVYLGSKKFSFVGHPKRIEENLEHTILDNAQRYLHTPYLWGGKSHAGIDCSGLVQVVFRSSGHKLKRDAWQQASMGSPVDDLKKAKSCDLAFFSNEKGRVTHVGILLDTATIIHAHGQVRIDKIDTIGIINGDTGLYSHTLSGIRRIVDESKHAAP
jgi:hypothetical protein